MNDAINLELVGAMVDAALREDVGAGDVTADLIAPTAKARAFILTREPGMLCGQAWAEQTFRRLDDAVTLHWTGPDGTPVQPNQHVCELAGSTRALLTGERVALNFLQTLSGTATRTHRYVQAVRHTRARILDTRKTVPGWRWAQKYAVRIAGGTNHRMGLYDALLIKENHIAAAGSIADAVRAARMMHPNMMLELEVEHLPQIDEALMAGVDRLLLDNFSLDDIRHAVSQVNRRCALEVSGNVSLGNIAALAETGVDFISIGDLTKNVSALDLSMRFHQP